MAVFVLGGAQTDFATRWSKAHPEAGLYEMLRAAVFGALEDAGVEPADVQVGHVGNFTAELFRGQGQLGGLFAALDPAFDGLPAARHEAACASGSVALMAAIAELEAGFYDVACVVGVEEMRNVHGDQAAAYLGAAAWAGREAQGARYLWPHLFSTLADVYAERYGLDHAHLMAIARTNYDNAKKNPLAQTRAWTFSEASFTEDEVENPVVEGRLRRHDCGRITDGAAAVVLVSDRVAATLAARSDRSLDDLPRVAGFGHRTAQMLLADKLDQSRGGGLVFPHVAGAIRDARRRAGLDPEDPFSVDGAEVHDCFTITEYMLIEHLGLAGPGEAWRAIEEGVVAPGGRCPINPSGGLIGLGHPVGATGVRMLHDAARQVSGRAGDCQVPGATTFQTVNIGGSATTTLSFVLTR